MIDFALKRLLVDEYLEADGKPNQKLKRLYIDLFKTDPGRIILTDLEHRFFIHATAKSEREEGMRDTVLHIENMLDPEPPAETEPQD